MPNPLRVLMIEDNVGDVELLEAIAGDGPAPLIILHARTMADASRHEDPIDFVLVDLKRPGFTGLDALRAACAAQLSSRVIVYSGGLNPTVARQAIELGAVATISKDRFADVAAILDAISRGDSAALSRLARTRGVTFSEGPHG